MDGARTGDGRETESCETDWALLGALSPETGVVLAVSGVRRGQAACSTEPAQIAFGRRGRAGDEGWTRDGRRAGWQGVSSGNVMDARVSAGEGGVGPRRLRGELGRGRRREREALR